MFFSCSRKTPLYREGQHGYVDNVHQTTECERCFSENMFFRDLIDTITKKIKFCHTYAIYPLSVFRKTPFDFLNIAETSRLNNVSSMQAIGVFGGNLPLGYEVIRFGIHHTTTKLACLQRLGDQRRTKVSEAMSYVTSASSLHLITSFTHCLCKCCNDCCRSSLLFLDYTSTCNSWFTSTPKRAPFLTQRHLRQRIQYGLSQAKQH